MLFVLTLVVTKEHLLGVRTQEYRQGVPTRGQTQKQVQEWHGVQWYGMGWYGIASHGMAWYGKACHGTSIPPMLVRARARPNLL